MGYLRRQAVIGLPVYVKEPFSFVGRVEDLLLNRKGERVVALLLDGGGLLARRFLPREEVLAFGPDAILVRKRVAMKTGGKKLEPLLEPARKLLGRRALDEGGRDLGTVDDIFFHPRTGRVAGYALSRGILADLLAGPFFLPREASLALGKEDILLVRRMKEVSPEET
ncbi:MAG: PRC-barrel domain-containing protein [Clostridiales bacterium]|nr:PRC-barrel domain-containing protein [Clostridiales bacterium]